MVVYLKTGLQINAKLILGMSKKDINMRLTAKDAPAKVATAPVSEADMDKMRAGKDGMEKPKGLLGWLKSAFSSDKDPDPDPN